MDEKLPDCDGQRERARPHCRERDHDEIHDDIHGDAIERAGCDVVRKQCGCVSRGNVEDERRRRRDQDVKCEPEKYSGVAALKA